MSGRSLGVFRVAEPHECDPAMNPETGLYDGNNAERGDVRECVECGAIWIKDEWVRSKTRVVSDFWWYRKVTNKRELRRILAVVKEAAT